METRLWKLITTPEVLELAKLQGFADDEVRLRFFTKLMAYYYQPLWSYTSWRLSLPPGSQKRWKVLGAYDRQDFAAELASAFLAYVWEKKIADRFDPAKGNFRYYLIGAFHFYYLKRYREWLKQPGAMNNVRLEDIEGGLLPASADPGLDISGPLSAFDVIDAQEQAKVDEFFRNAALELARRAEADAKLEFRASYPGLAWDLFRPFLRLAKNERRDGVTLATIALQVPAEFRGRVGTIVTQLKKAFLARLNDLITEKNFSLGGSDNDDQRRFDLKEVFKVYRLAGDEREKTGDA